MHKNSGKIYRIIRRFTAIVRLSIPAQVSATSINHFRWLRSLSLQTIYSVPKAYKAIKKGNTIQELTSTR